jgi:hypothetical protein
VTTPPSYGSPVGEPQGYPGQPAPGYPPGYPTGATPQQPYGQQPYGQQPYGQTPGYPAAPVYPGAPGYPPGYGAPGFGVPMNRRPGLVTAAAVLAFIFGAGSIFQALFGVVFASVASTVAGPGGYTQSAVNLLCDTSSATYDADSCNSARASLDTVNTVTSGFGTFAVILAIGSAIVAILMIWGGVVALSGKNGQLVVIAAGIYVVLAIVLMIATTFGFFYIFGIVLPILITIFMLNSASKAWIRSKGGKTF